MIRHPIVSFMLAVAMAWSALPAATSAAARKHYFNVRSPGDHEFGYLASKNASDRCGGQNVSPPLRWLDAPAATKSYAIELFDIGGNPPLGVVHWLAYGIPATVKSLAEGEASKPSSDIKGGKNTAGIELYSGPCPPPGAKPHPYTFLVMATDLAPDALAAGLTRDQLAAALKGHILDRTTLVLRYGR